MRNIPWDDLQLFLAVAEARSVSGAARSLQLGQPTVSRRLAALEYQVGTALFLRSAGGVSLTVAGERLLPAARRMAEFAAEAGRSLDAGGGKPRGLVRVTANPSVSFEFLAPFAGHLATRQPGVQLEVLSTIQYLDLARGEADLAIRTREPTQPELSVVTRVKVESAVYVSPSLAKRLPRRPTLAEVPWIGWAPPYENVPPQPQLAAMIPNFRPVFTSDHYLIHLAAAQSGVGAVILFKARHRFLRERGLVELPIDLGTWRLTDVLLVSARSALEIPRVRIVSELLARELGSIEAPSARRA